MLVPDTSKQASAVEYELDRAKYDASRDGKIDGLLDELSKVTSTSFGEDFVAYFDTHNLVTKKLRNMNMSEHEWMKAGHRHGLPYHLRIALSLYVPSSEVVANPSLIRSGVINTLRAAQDRFLEAHPRLATSSSSGTGPESTEQTHGADHIAAAQAPKRQKDDESANSTEELRAAKRFKGNSTEEDNTSTQEKEISSTDPQQVGDTTTTTMQTVTPTVPKRKRQKRATKASAAERMSRASIRKLAEPEVSTSEVFKSEPSLDTKGDSLYFRGPLMTAYSVCPYLVEFATIIPTPGPVAMNVETLPKPKIMRRIINDTMRNYARSRTSRNMTDAALGFISDEEAIEPVDLDHELLKEPTQITKAKTLQQSLAMVSGLWKQKHMMGVRQKVLESWAIDIVDKKLAAIKEENFQLRSQVQEWWLQIGELEGQLSKTAADATDKEAVISALRSQLRNDVASPPSSQLPHRAAAKRNSTSAFTPDNSIAKRQASMAVGSSAAASRLVNRTVSVQVPSRPSSSMPDPFSNVSTPYPRDV